MDPDNFDRPLGQEDLDAFNRAFTPVDHPDQKSGQFYLIDRGFYDEVFPTPECDSRSTFELFEKFMHEYMRWDDLAHTREKSEDVQAQASEILCEAVRELGKALDTWEFDVGFRLSIENLSRNLHRISDYVGVEAHGKISMTMVAVQVELRTDNGQFLLFDADFKRLIVTDQPTSMVFMKRLGDSRAKLMPRFIVTQSAMDEIKEKLLFAEGNDPSNILLRPAAEALTSHTYGKYGDLNPDNFERAEFRVDQEESIHLYIKVAGRWFRGFPRINEYGTPEFKRIQEVGDLYVETETVLFRDKK
ncbi:MAG: hypothetical protein H6619_03680 [Deltaproteobacteria bacterium]|nr:hypothetical protein [Deltaproteobacteria bacterium]